MDFLRRITAAFTARWMSWGPPATLRETVTSHLASEPSERRAPFVVLFWIGAANVIGGVVVFIYLNYISDPLSDVTHRNTTSRLALFVTYGSIAVIIGGIRMITAIRPVWQWLIRPRPLQPHERVTALHLPITMAREAMGYWLGAVVAFAALNVLEHMGAAEILRVMLGIFLGGVSASAFTYLFVEVSLRPVFIRALEGEVIDNSLALGIRAKLSLSRAMGSGIPMLWIALSPFGREDREAIIDLALLAWVGIVSGGTMVYIAAGSVAARLAVVRHAMLRVQEGDIEIDLLVDDGGELGRLQAGFNEMVAGLRQREQLQNLFERHVGDEVARHA
ncbi:MAG: HAMP domain-containing protein, partial [Actinobacteria bacterium]|nr:HAMP domain-containing protein [Actinomycetota bacterium]